MFHKLRIVKPPSYISDFSCRHEIAYVIGQSGCMEASDVLVKLLEDVNEDPMVRHEVGFST